MTEIAMIAAMAKDRVIGKDNKMPWHLPADLQHFKRVTMAKPIIMGRKTFQSLGRPLPGRQNIVITRSKDFDAPGCEVVYGVDEALEFVNGQPSAMIIGGAEIYRLFLPMAKRLFLTYIDIDTEGDTYFPEINEEDWKLIAQQAGELNEKNTLAHQFVELERI